MQPLCSFLKFSLCYKFISCTVVCNMQQFIFNDVLQISIPSCTVSREFTENSVTRRNTLQHINSTIQNSCVCVPCVAASALSVLLCVAACHSLPSKLLCIMLFVCCCVLQQALLCVAVWCGVSQYFLCVAVCCGVSWSVLRTHRALLRIHSARCVFAVCCGKYSVCFAVCCGVSQSLLQAALYSARCVLLCVVASALYVLLYVAACHSLSYELLFIVPFVYCCVLRQRL